MKTHRTRRIYFLIMAFFYYFSDEKHIYTLEEREIIGIWFYSAYKMNTSKKKDRYRQSKREISFVLQSILFIWQQSNNAWVEFLHKL